MTNTVKLVLNVTVGETTESDKFGTIIPGTNLKIDIENADVLPDFTAKLANRHGLFFTKNKDDNITDSKLAQENDALRKQLADMAAKVDLLLNGSAAPAKSNGTSNSPVPPAPQPAPPMLPSAPVSTVKAKGGPKANPDNVINKRKLNDEWVNYLQQVVTCGASDTDKFDSINRAFTSNRIKLLSENEFNALATKWA